MNGVGRPVIVDGETRFETLWAAVKEIAKEQGRQDVKAMYASCYEACKHQRGRKVAYGHTFEFARRSECYQ